MSVTFNQPIRVNKYNNPTNNGVIAPDNCGAVSASQQVQFTATPTANTAITTVGIGYSSAANSTVTIPAGAIITNIKFIETSAPTALTGGVITVNVGANAVGTITPTTSFGVVAFAPANTANAVLTLANIGNVDQQIAFNMGAITATGTLAGVFTVEYTARNTDGSIINVGQGFTNT